MIGKGMYLWLMSRAELPAEIAWLAKRAGLGHILVKIADGAHVSQGDIEQLIGFLHREGIQAIGWQYIYSGSTDEANVAVRLCRQYGLDGFVVNAEVQFDREGMDGAARNYMARLRSGLGDSFVIGLSSYRYPTQHAKFPWKAFLERCDINMPQVYWMGDERLSAPARQALASAKEFRALYQKLGFARPILMTGAAFSEHGWVASPGQVEAFLGAVNALADKDELVLRACNFWEWWEARTENPGLWPAIAQYPWRFTPMSDFDQWAQAITCALRQDGHTIPNPPVTTTPDPETFQVRFDTTINLRDAPAGKDIGDVSGIVTIQAPTQKKIYKGRWYEWGQVVDPANKKGWVALENGVRL
ncbi:MAG: hypothetical protein ACOYYS_19810 [Chloroflexota bacterium]